MGSVPPGIDEALAEKPEVTLVVVTTADAEALFAALDHPEVGTYIGGPYAPSADDLRQLIERWMAGPPAGADERWLNFVARLPDDTVIGHVQATVHSGWAEVAWVVGSPWWGHGYGTQSARALIEMVAREHQVGTLWATIHPDNARSERLLRRLRFRESVLANAPQISSFDAGDRIFVRDVQP